MKKLRILILFIVLGTFLFASLSPTADFKYVGSSNSKKYHYPDCKWILLWAFVGGEGDRMKPLLGKLGVILIGGILYGYAEVWGQDWRGLWKR